MNDPAVVSAYLGGAKAAAATPKAAAARPRFQLRRHCACRSASRRLAARWVLWPPGQGASSGRSSAPCAAKPRRRRPSWVATTRRRSDPWQEVAAEEVSRPGIAAAPLAVAADARRLGENASDFAARASERLAAHIAARRLTAKRPSAFDKPLLAQPEPQSPAAPAAPAAVPVRPAEPAAPKPEDVAPPKPSLIGTMAACP